MPDDKTRVETAPDSSKIKITVPVAGSKTRPTDTQVQVDPGTQEHEVLVEDVPHEEMPERRRRQPPVNVQVQQPNAGGLLGPWATLANLSAVGVVIVFLFWVYRDSQSNQKEFLQQVREDRLQDRLDNKSADSAMVAALSSLSVKMDAIAASNQAMATSNNAMILEMQRARQEVTALVKVLTEKKPPEEE